MQQPSALSPSLRKTNWIKIISLTVLGLLAAVGLIFTGIQIGKNQAYTQQSIISQPTPLQTQRITTPTVLPTMSAITSTPGSTVKAYTDPNGRYSFNYSTDYILLSAVPSLFDGTMLDQVKNNCRGPVLQNISNPNVLIVMEIVPSDSDGGFCWSNGTFTKDDKWIGGGSDVWKGSFFVTKEVRESTKYIGFIGLANRETYSLKGQDDLNQIVSTFKFLN
jgi:hypothetical protein